MSFYVLLFSDLRKTYLFHFSQAIWQFSKFIFENKDEVFIFFSLPDPSALKSSQCCFSRQQSYLHKPSKSLFSSIMLIEISHTESQTLDGIIYLWNLKKTKLVNITKKDDSQMQRTYCVITSGEMRRLHRRWKRRKGQTVSCKEISSGCFCTI